MRLETSSFYWLSWVGTSLPPHLMINMLFQKQQQQTHVDG
jgi:hypothetical protein